MISTPFAVRKPLLQAIAFLGSISFFVCLPFPAFNCTHVKRYGIGGVTFSRQAQVEHISYRKGHNARADSIIFGPYAPF